MTLGEVIGGIRPGDTKAKRAATQRQQRLTKPPGSLGRLEDLSVQLAGIFGTDRPTVQHTTVIVAAADHGVVAQGVTGYPQAVTAEMVRNFLAGGAAISVMARTRGVDLVIVDAGVATPLPDHPNLRVVAPGRGARDITQGQAMTRDQADTCIRASATGRDDPALPRARKGPRADRSVPARRIPSDAPRVLKHTRLGTYKGEGDPGRESRRPTTYAKVSTRGDDDVI